METEPRLVSQALNAMGHTIWCIAQQQNRSTLVVRHHLYGRPHRRTFTVDLDKIKPMHLELREVRYAILNPQFCRRKLRIRTSQLSDGRREGRMWTDRPWQERLAGLEAAMHKAGCICKPGKRKKKHLLVDEIQTALRAYETTNAGMSVKEYLQKMFGPRILQRMLK